MSRKRSIPPQNLQSNHVKHKAPIVGRRTSQLNHGSGIHPLDELQMLTLPSLFVFTDEETCRPQLKITCFWVNDLKDHVVPFSDGLIEKGHHLFLNGWVKEVTAESAKIEDAVPVGITSPVVEWWFSGFDGSNEIIVGLETEHASYILMDPHPCYVPVFQPFLNQLLLCKFVIETLTFRPEIALPDLYEAIGNRSNDRFSSDSMHRKSSFLIQQIANYDEAGTDEDIKISDTQAFKDFVDLNINSKPKSNGKIARRDCRRISNSDNLTVTTPLVSQFFSIVFSRTFESSSTSSSKLKRTSSNFVVKKPNVVKWSSEVIAKDEVTGHTHYSEVQVDGETYFIGDFIYLKPKNIKTGLYGQVKWMFENKNRKKFLHVSILSSGSSTILGSVSDPSILFQVNKCQDVEVSCMVQKIIVKNRRDLIKLFDETDQDNPIYYCDKSYDENTGWFSDIPQEYFELGKYCQVCQKPSHRNPVVFYSHEKCLIANDVEYRAGDFVLVDPSSYEEVDYLQDVLRVKRSSLEEVDEEEYPEYFRKNLAPLRGIFSNCLKVCKVARIEDFQQVDQVVNVKIRKLLRVWNVKSTFEEIMEADINEIFWSDHLLLISPTQLVRKCSVALDLVSGTDFVMRGHEFRVLPHRIKCNQNVRSGIKDSGKIKLSGLDLFCGAGGLAKGFEDIVDTRWAIERDGLACESFKLNFPSCNVINGDANKILQLILSDGGDTKLNLPFKGEVDIILAGPPCQGFSNMNRFSSGNYSSFKNSLVATTLSYVDYYRPRYVYFENVRNFFKFNQGLIFKLALSCLIRMNYQVSFSVLQAGCYGVPQTRKRAFIIAAMTGHPLPPFPPFINSFQLSEIQSSLTIDGTKLHLTIPMFAIHRPLTIYDAISDLPSIDDKTIAKPRTSFQRELRNNFSDIVSEHVVRLPSLLNRARIERIPLNPGSDWRDLPNIECQLSDGKMVKKLYYRYENSRKRQRRGVCTCFEGSSSCSDPLNRQEMTLIPWCLAHTAHRNLQWSGLFGRLGWNEYFSTTVTIPEPISKQGRVIHPKESRVISVREAARSQGFPDDYIFCGSISDKYRQIGNAVPPPLAKALARQLEQVLKSS